MLKYQFERSRQYRVVIYARMSSSKQNKRSPDQQIKLINDLLKRLQLPWRVVATYRDDAISGRYTRKRPGFSKMRQDLRSGVVRADLILVDTLERLSRADNIDEIRRKLKRSGVLVLTADSQFADPTSSSGRALAMVEGFRASEEGRIKAHQVVRGKKDAVLEGHWPGGPVPFGFRLKSIMKFEKGVEKVDYSVLVPDPRTRKIVVLIFYLAAKRGWGCGRIARFLKTYPLLPEGVPLLKESTIAYILQNRVYVGEYVWGTHCTDVEDDVRVMDSMPEEDWETNENFCPAIVSRVYFELVQRQKRARRRLKSAPPESEERGMTGLRHRGVALKYPLSGLVTCGECGLAMIASSGGAYVTVDGIERRYTAYVCRGHYSGSCTNTCHVPEDWLRACVVNLVRQRLFLAQPDSSTEDTQ